MPQGNYPVVCIGSTLQLGPPFTVEFEGVPFSVAG